MTADKQTTFLGESDWRRPGFLLLHAQFAIVLSEVMLSSGLWRVTYPLAALSLFSPSAQKIWACVLMSRVLLLAIGCPTWIEHLLTLNFVAIRIVFVWAMLARHRLLADSRFVRAVSNWCVRHTVPLVGCLMVAALTILIRSFLGHVEKTLSSAVVVCALICASVRWYKYYVAQGGTRLGTLVGTVKLKDVLLMAGTVALCLTGFEIVMRTCFPQTRVKPTGLYRVHATRIFDLAPGATGVHKTHEYHVRYKTNALGLKDFEVAPKTPETFRVLCVGDSFTMGDGLTVGQTYPKQLERMLLEEHPGASISVVNFGISAYGTIQQLSKLREEGFALQPDLVILQLYPENDIRDNLRFVGKFMRSADVEHHRNLDRALARITLRARLTRFFRRHSYAFTFVNNRWRVLARRTNTINVSKRKPRKYRAIPGRPWWLETSLKEYYPELEEGWRVTETAVQEFRDECAKRNIPFYALVAPAKQELTGEMARARVVPTEADLDLYDFSTNWRRAHEIFERLNIPHIDVRNKMLDTEHPELYYWLHDAHMNSVGSKFIAALLKPVVWKEYREWVGGVRKSEP